jgi:hypothetical protein
VREAASPIEGGRQPGDQGKARRGAAANLRPEQQVVRVQDRQPFRKSHTNVGEEAIAGPGAIGRHSKVVLPQLEPVALAAGQQRLMKRRHDVERDGSGDRRRQRCQQDPPPLWSGLVQTTAAMLISAPRAEATDKATSALGNRPEPVAR